MEELKPCPFCGGEATVKRIESIYRYRVSCDKCPVEVGRHWFGTKEEAIEAWNRRVSE